MGKDQQPAAVAPTLYEVTMTGSEVAQVLQAGGDSEPSIKKIQVKCRTSADITYGYASGSTVVTLPADHTYFQDGLDARDLTIYLTGTAALIVEVEVWV